MSLRVLTRENFCQQCLDLLVELMGEDGTRVRDGLPPDAVEKMTIWELGFDSALMIELVLFIEDLGAVIPDSLLWESITLGDLYSEYAMGVVAGELPMGR